jgi:3-isopropylmalate dehydratase small subunit
MAWRSSWRSLYPDKSPRSVILLIPLRPTSKHQPNTPHQGKCTTDHISPAGPWYKYRGHLENISNNLLTGAESDIAPKSKKPLRGETLNLLTNTIAAVPSVAKSYRQAGIRWCIIGDWNYGEGSSREHAALEPRFLGGVAVVARSFARIHETNLKKQGMLALTFKEPEMYDAITVEDKLDILGADDLVPGKNLVLRVRKADGEEWETELVHTYHEGQIPWLKHGSALNAVKMSRAVQWCTVLLVRIMRRYGGLSSHDIKAALTSDAFERWVEEIQIHLLCASLVLVVLRRQAWPASAHVDLGWERVACILDGSRYRYSVSVFTTYLCGTVWSPEDERVVASRLFLVCDEAGARWVLDVAKKKLYIHNQPFISLDEVVIATDKQ